ncbi:MAG: Tim44/TimA family putative adaptor protein [Actinomycetota bacterium]
MSDGFHFLDIVFFAMVAAFLVLRLRSVLGKRTGHERPPEQWQGAGAPSRPNPDNVIDLGRARRSANEPGPNTPVGMGLSAIRAADPAFDADAFLGGARQAFEMIVAAYAAGDKAALQPLLAPDVWRHFAEAIDTRRRAGETLDTELLAMRQVEFVEARMDGASAVVTLRFVSEQINLLRDASGTVVEGDPERVAEVKDEWTFRRDVRSTDPNWLLVGTRTPADGA